MPATAIAPATITPPATDWIPSSYNSRDVDLAWAGTWPDTQLEFRDLRLDQTGVELPGQAFDIDGLGTDGYEVATSEDQPYFDRLARRLVQPARVRWQRPAPGKRRQFPIYDFMNFVGFTDVDSVSTGFRWRPLGAARTASN